MAKAQPTVEPVESLVAPEVVIPVLDVASTLEPIDESKIGSVSPLDPQPTEVLMEGVKSGTSYTMPNGTVVTNH